MANVSLILVLLGVVLFTPCVRSLKCYVCNSHEAIDGADCASSDKAKLANFSVECDSKFVTTVYGDLKHDKGEPETGTKPTKGWAVKLNLADGERDKGSTTDEPPPLHIQHANYRLFEAPNGEIGKETAYDVCRILSIQTPDTTVKKDKPSEDGKDTGKVMESKKAITDPARIIRLCGRRNAEDPKDGKCKDYRSRGGATHGCVCDKEECNGAPGIASASKLIVASLGIFYIVFF